MSGLGSGGLDDIDWVPDCVRQSPYFEMALTHRSAGHHNYERLEFLGDAVLGVVMAEALFIRRPKSSEGDLSRLRSALVKRSTLAAIAREKRLGDYLRLGEGELKSGGFRRDSTLSDVVEAIIGAHYLVTGFEATRTFVLDLYHERLNALPEAQMLKDPKTRLQEWLQQRGYDLPDYQVIETSGPPHQRQFLVRCQVEAPQMAVEMRESSRKKAEQACAEKLLQSIEDHRGTG